MFDSITLFVTTRCQGTCPQCTSRRLAQREGLYDMTLEEVDEFLRVCKQSGYRFAMFKISAREPLLWPHLAEGIRRLSASGVADGIAVLTNALAFAPEREGEFVKALEPVKWLRVSKYNGNEDRVAAMVRRIPRTIVAGVGLHGVLPTKPAKGTLPADCGCIGLGLFRGTVTLCCGIHPLYANLGLDPRTHPEYCRPLAPGCLDGFDIGARNRQPHCESCLGNSKVMATVAKEPTRCSDHARG